jgi:phenylacetate-CoA ligase
MTNSVFNAVHEVLARRVLLPASRVRRLVHPGRRLAMRAYYHGISERRKLQRLSENERRQWLIHRLRLLARYAAGTTTYYRDLFQRIGFDPRRDFSFDDFARLPVLEKDHIRRAGKDLISNRVPADLLFKDATGGSSGVPTVLWVGPDELGWRESGLELSMARIGVPTGVRTAFFWGHNLDPVNRDSLRDRYHDFENNRRWFDCFRLSPEQFESYHRAFQEWQPACIVAYASALGQFANYISERGYQTNYPTVCFVTGAEKLLPAHREAINRVFKRRVHERYGSRDCGLMGFQYRPDQSLDFEIDWPNVFIEPETNDSVSSILVTKLHADGMPMLRYRIGDLGRFPEGSRPGQPVLMLHEVIGRESARIWLPDGRWIVGEQFPHMLKDYPVKEYRCTQRADYSVQLDIVPTNGFSEENEQRILDTMGVNLPGLEVRISLVNEIPRTAANKWQPVVSEVQKV